MRDKAWSLASSVLLASVAAIVLFYGTFGIGGGTLQPNWEGGYNYTLSFVFENPVETIMIFFRTVYLEYQHWFFNMIGSNLSGFTLYIPAMYVYAVILLLVASIFYGKRDEWYPSPWQRTAFIVICAAVIALCMTSMFLGWTSDTRSSIIGVQGRYFIPILPLILLTFKWTRMQVPFKLYGYAIIAGVIVTQGFIIRHLFDHTLSLLS